jgi:hypothetical protein
MTTMTATKSRSHEPLTAEQKAQRVKDAHDRITAGVEAIQTSEDWMNWLRFGAKFHRYSFNNVMLILIQCPEATRVASAGTWRRDFNRFPRKGTKAIWIFAPIIVKWTAAEIAEKPERAGQSHLVGFKTVPVFDVSQTDGDPLPEDPTAGLVDLLDDDAPDLADEVAALVATLGYTIGSGDPDSISGSDGALGVTDLVNRTITIRPGMSNAQTFKTIMHEIAHADLHDPRVRPDDLSRSIAEVEAESVAFIVCEYFGVKSDAYSFGYVAGWAHEDVTATIRTGQRVMTAAKKIIAALEGSED